VFVDKAFFSFIGLDDISKHHEYNAWHQLDHLPENFALDEVFWGDRWVRSPDCVRLSTGLNRDLVDADYVVMYWLNDPPAESNSQWLSLAERAIHWGRRPELAWTRRLPLGFFQLGHGFAAPRVLVSPEVIPLRPHRGVHLSLTRVLAPQSPQAVELFRWYDQVHIPRLLQFPGVAGAWTFYSSLMPASLGLSSEGSETGGELQLRILYFDEDPVTAVTRIESDFQSIAGPPSEHEGIEEVLVSGPLRTIRPWEWDWFDEG
jgi:hypothetical protein